ncbi:MAG: ABC transporter substrate-binding protein [Chloroflexi bacterium]|nr:ABC transporter substrate-binding protein [Chloroflexota bacterium]
MFTDDLADVARNRRELFHLIGLSGTAATAAAGAGVLAACGGTQTTGTGSAAQGGAGGAGGAGGTSGKSENMTLRVGYLPITDATPLLVAHGKGMYAAEGLEAPKPTLFRGWSQLAEAFQARQVDVVHILMPTAVWMRFGQNFAVKLVAWNHTDGSALTVANKINKLEDIAGTTVAVPFWYSIHNLVLQLLMRKAGLRPITRGEPSAADKTVKLVVMAPPDMPPAIANGSISGYIVADPFNAVAEVNQVGKILRFTGDAWLNHACCVVIMHEDDTVNRPKWAQAVVNAVAKAQLFSRENRSETAKLLAKGGAEYLPQPVEVVDRALSYYDRNIYKASGAIVHPNWSNNRIDFQPFPFPSYTEELVKLLKDTVVEGDNAFLKTLDPKQAHAKLIDDRFARAAIKAAGGAAKFGIPESLSRTEQIAP